MPYRPGLHSAAMDGGTGAGGAAGCEFKRVLDRAMAEIGLSARTLHYGLLRQAGCDIPESTIDSWRRPHRTPALRPCLAKRRWGAARQVLDGVDGAHGRLGQHPQWRGGDPPASSRRPMATARAPTARPGHM